MSVPVVKVNSFLGRKYVDNISKLFIMISLVFGINRINLLENVDDIYLNASLAYSFIVTGVVTASGLFIFFKSNDYFFLIDVLKYTLISVLTFTMRERFQRFYKEIDQFDEKIGYNIKITKSSIQNMIQMLFILLVALFFVTVHPKQFEFDYIYLIYVMVVAVLSFSTLAHCLEMYYLGHLISLFLPRIRLVSYHIKVSYPVNDCDTTTICDCSYKKFKKEMKRKAKLEMGDLMDLYYSVVKAFDYMNDAMKWQLLTLLTTTFVVSMGVSYDIASDAISGNFDMAECLSNSFIFLDIFPMFTICFFADQVCREVNKLKDVLFTSFSENTMDKTTRTSAQAFLGLIEARDLSFSLFNMFNIGVTFPFNFISLLLTYLIILLQFQKVKSPHATA